MPEIRYSGAASQREGERALMTIEEMEARLLAGEPIKSTPDKPTIHQHYSVGDFTIDGKQERCLFVAIPLNQSWGDLRLNPERYVTDANGVTKLKTATVGLTVSATCPPEAEPPQFTFMHINGTRVQMAVSKGLILNLSITGKPQVAESKPVAPPITVKPTEPAKPNAK